MTGAGAVSSWSDSIWRSPSTSWTSVPSAAGIAARTEACIITKTMNIAQAPGIEKRATSRLQMVTSTHGETLAVAPSW
jgi:hypothetical protein